MTDPIMLVTFTLGGGSYQCPVCNKSYFPPNWYEGDSGECEGDRFWTDRSGR